MDGFTLFDAAVALVIVVSAILAYSRGLIREILAIAGWIIAAVAAFALAPIAEPLMGEIPFVGNILGGSCELTIITAFAAVFAVMLMIVALFTPLFSSLIRNSALGGVDQALGFFFGGLRGILLIAVAIMVYQAADIPPDTLPMVENSYSITLFGGVQQGLSEQLPQDAPNWIVQRYEDLVSSCTAA